MNFKICIRHAVCVLAFFLCICIFPAALKVSIQAMGVELSRSISMLNLIFGFEVEGYHLDGTIVLLITLFIPLIMIVLNLIGQSLGKTLAIINIALAAVDTIIWFFCRAMFLKGIREELSMGGFDLSSMVHVQLGGGFIMTLLFCFIIAVLSILSLIGILDLNTVLAGKAYDDTPVAVARPAPERPEPAHGSGFPEPSFVPERAEEKSDEPWVCPNCGSVLRPVAKFCTKCGAKKPVAAAAAKPVGVWEPGPAAESSDTGSHTVKMDPVDIPLPDMPVFPAGGADAPTVPPVSEVPPAIPVPEAAPVSEKPPVTPAEPVGGKEKPSSTSKLWGTDADAETPSPAAGRPAAPPPAGPAPASPSGKEEHGPVYIPSSEPSSEDQMKVDTPDSPWKAAGDADLDF